MSALVPPRSVLQSLQRPKMLAPTMPAGGRIPSPFLVAPSHPRGEKTGGRIARVFSTTYSLPWILPPCSLPRLGREHFGFFLPDFPALEGDGGREKCSLGRRVLVRVALLPGADPDHARAGGVHQPSQTAF